MSEKSVSKYRNLVWTSELIKKYWDYYSNFPETYFTYLFGDVIVSRLSPYLPSRGIVLDLGCGTGFLIGHLLDRGYRVWGVDTSQDSVDSVNSRYAGREGFLGAFLPGRLPEFSQTNKPQVVFAIEVLEHLGESDIEKYLSALREIAKDAQVIVTVPNEERLGESTVYCPNCDHTFHKWQHLRSWSRASLVAVLEARGFVVEKAFVTDFSISFSKNKSAFLKRKLVSLVKNIPMPHLAAVCHVKPAR